MSQSFVVKIADFGASRSYRPGLPREETALQLDPTAALNVSDFAGTTRWNAPELLIKNNPCWCSETKEKQEEEEEEEEEE